jgi:ribosomal protein S21
MDDEQENVRARTFVLSGNVEAALRKLKKATRADIQRVRQRRAFMPRPKIRHAKSRRARARQKAIE